MQKKKEIKEHIELEGKTVIAEDKKFKVTKCYGRIFSSPEGSMFYEHHGKYMYSFLGFDENESFVRKDVFSFELIDNQ
ncbi:hypothetical protein [Gottfriedia solisilvae]|uniref:hypothetical protein n=1 Tax=Gottfriedia solisilvae TaxID=1516104 RepID=UPI003D2F353D